MEQHIVKKPITQRHFSKIHEKVQIKYEEMQRKLHRSKSIDCLSIATSDDSEIRQTDSVKDESKNLSLLNEDTFKFEATTLIFDKKYAIIEENVSPKVSFSKVTDNTFEFSGFNEIHDTNINIFKLKSASFESLTEPSEGNESLSSSKNVPQRVRLRDKIATARKKRAMKKEEEKRTNERKREESSDNIDKVILSSSSKNEFNKFTKRNKTATLTIALVNAKNVRVITNEDKVNNIYCKFRLGFEKYKSKPIKYNAIEINWLELFNLNIYEEFMLEISLCNKDNAGNSVGRKVIDISKFETEITHEMKIKLDDENETEIFLLLTISGTYFLNTVMDTNHLSAQNELDKLKKKFAWYHLAEDYSDIGYMSVLIYCAKGLPAYNTYCVVELDNNRRQTHTEIKTCDPNWMKVFHFTITDINSIIEVTIHDEIKKSEVIGKISVPLLRIDNGEKKWYALKDKTQRERAKGQNPRLLIEMSITWNPVKAAFRTLNPKEWKYLDIEPKFNRHLFVRNMTRCKPIISWVLDIIMLTKTCFEWESKKWSFIALLIWLVVCWFFEPWMLPFLILIPFIRYRPPQYRIKGETYLYSKLQCNTPDNDTEAKVEKEEKKSIMEKLSNLQDITTTVQNTIGQVASVGESVKNLVNFRVPFLSLLAILILSAIILVVYLIPIKFIFMAWAINKFTRKIIRPNRIPNNEILDLLSRVPNDETLLDCEELHLDEDDEKFV